MINLTRHLNFAFNPDESENSFGMKIGWVVKILI